MINLPLPPKEYNAQYQALLTSIEGGSGGGGILSALTGIIGSENPLKG